MFGQGTFEIEFALKTLAAPTDIIGITGQQSFDFGQTIINGKVALNIIRQMVLSKTAGVGLNDVDNLGLRDPYQRIHLFGSNITNVEVTADRNKVFETTAARNASLLADNGLTVQANMFPICFDHTERIDDSLSVDKELLVRFNTTTAQQVYILHEARAPGYM